MEVCILWYRNTSVIIMRVITHFKKQNKNKNPLLLHCWCQPTFSSGLSWTTFAGLGPTLQAEVSFFAQLVLKPCRLYLIFRQWAPSECQKMSLDSLLMAGEVGWRVSCITFLAKLVDLLRKNPIGVHGISRDCIRNSKAGQIWNLK